MKIRLCDGDNCCGDAAGGCLWSKDGRFVIGRGDRWSEASPSCALGMHAGGNALATSGAVEEVRGRASRETQEPLQASGMSCSSSANLRELP